MTVRQAIRYNWCMLNKLTLTSWSNSTPQPTVITCPITSATECIPRVTHMGSNTINGSVVG